MYTKEQRKRIALASVMLMLIPVFLSLFSEYMQHKENLGIYWWIYSNIGHVWADICLGQLGDLMTPIALAGIFMVCVLGLGKILKKNLYEDAVIIVIIVSILASIAYMLAEILTIFIGTEVCNTQNDICRGEFRDLLSFSAPLIAYVVWRIIRHYRLKQEV